MREHRRLISRPQLQDASRHRSVDTLRGYERDVEFFKDHAGPYSAGMQYMSH